MSGTKTDLMRENRERWMELCQQASTEQDPEKLLALVREITRLLEAKQERLNREMPPTESKKKE